MALPTGANARTMFEQPRKAYVLMGLEPNSIAAIRNSPWLPSGQASLVVFMSAFKHSRPSSTPT